MFVVGFLVCSFVIFKIDIKKVWLGRVLLGVILVIFGCWRSIIGIYDYWIVVWRIVLCLSILRSCVILIVLVSFGIELVGDDGRWVWLLVGNGGRWVWL